MPFVKLVKNKAYFMRYQVKYKRRQEGKTDYRARRQMVLQDKTKYGAPKYRLVVRRTNTDIIAQIVHAKIVGDDVVQAAYSHELPAFGINFGLTNYAAAYATGLLVARRLLTKLKIDKKFEGAKTIDGEFKKSRVKNDPEDESEDRFPFKAILDVGLSRTTTGARLFGVLKGAVDGGIAVPHKPTRFPGFNQKTKKFDAKKLRERIFGGHVAAYMKKVSQEKAANPDEKNVLFAKYEKAGVKPEKLEELYKKAHAAIRANPLKKLDKKAKPAGAKSKDYSKPRKTRPQRKEAAKKKVAEIRKRLGK